MARPQIKLELREVVELYVNQQLTVDETAKRLKVSKNTLLREMDRFGLKRRKPKVVFQ